LYKCKVIKNATPQAYGMPAFAERAREPRGRTPEEIERDAYSEGFAAGEEAGMQMAEEKAGVLLERLERTIGELAGLKAETLAELESQVLRLSTAIARKIIADELTARPEALAAMVREALSRIDRNGRVTIKLNPALKDLIGRLRPGLLEMHQDIVFETDPSAPPGGPLVIGPREEVAVDVEAQIAAIAEEAGLAGD